ncbi:Glucose-induced degradation complex subunit [Sorochytrium milnesiophthora]
MQRQGAAPHKRTIGKDEWEKKLADVNISKPDLNRLIMNYLVIEGYKDAAQSFSAESGVAPSVDLSSIQDRMLIRNAVQSGNIDEAIERVNDLDPEILDTNPHLYFRLQQQKMIEHIRKGDIDTALEFAQEELASRGEENPQYLQELEKTVSLLAFDVPSRSPMAELLDAGQRQKTASELNAAILLSQSQEKDPKLPSLLRMLIWSQNQLEDRVTFPKINNLLTAELSAIATSGGGTSF